MEKTYELRKLMAVDIFPMSQILSKIGVKELKDCFNNQEMINLAKGKKVDDNLTKQVGITIAFEMASVILANLNKIENDLYKFLSNLSGLKVEEISKLPLSEFTEMIIQVVRKEEFVDFFKVVSKLFK